jgi:predicted AlkP superfamily pyrophosphatase or phosphodiesterase
MITGTLPADHGVTSDFAFDVADAIQSKQPFESAKDIKTSPIFELAERAKLVTAAVGFPVTSGAAISFNLPEEVEGGNGSPSQSGARPDARPVVSGSANPPNLRAEILSAIKPELNVAPVGKGDKGISSPEDLFKASAAAYLIEKYKPNLLLVNFASFEAAQRRYGILSEESLRSLEMTDGMIKKIIDATNRAQIAEETTFLLVADSGAAKVEKEYSPNVLLAKKGWLKTDAQGRVVSWQAVIQSFEGSAAVYIKDPKDEDFAREVEAFFHEQAGKPDSPIWRVMPKRETSKLGADPRAVLYLDAAPTYVFTARTTGAPFTKAATRAARGYAPSRVEMRAAFLIAGAGIKPGVKVEYARLIDVAPTIARLLGLEMKTARGRALTEVIRE